jgi:hypothetical protein
MKFLFILKQIPVYVANIPNSGLFMFIGCTNTFRLLRRGVFFST